MISYQFRSSRIGVLLLLDFNKKFKVVQVYTPAAASNDDEAEEFCDDLESTLVLKIHLYGCDG